MIPFHFGRSSRRLFGIYEPARAGTAPSRAVVICYPEGAEHVCAYRTMRALAERLVRAGLHVLRFDYYGTGDSDGDSSPERALEWLDDIETAIEEVKQVSGAARVTVVGLRLGANLAACLAARRRGLIEQLVLWEPLDFARSPLPFMADLELPRHANSFPDRTLVLLTSSERELETAVGTPISQINDVPPWTEERITSGTVPNSALEHIVEWLR